MPATGRGLVDDGMAMRLPATGPLLKTPTRPSISNRTSGWHSRCQSRCHVPAQASHFGRCQLAKFGGFRTRPRGTRANLRQIATQVPN